MRIDTMKNKYINGIMILWAVLMLLSIVIAVTGCGNIHGNTGKSETCGVHVFVCRGNKLLPGINIDIFRKQDIRDICINDWKREIQETDKYGRYYYYGLKVGIEYEARIAANKDYEGSEKFTVCGDWGDVVVYAARIPETPVEKLEKRVDKLEVQVDSILNEEE